MASDKKDQVEDLTTSILRSNLYIVNGQFIIIYHNTERKSFLTINYFEIIKNGQNLFLHFSEGSEDQVKKHSIDLTFVDNINGVPIP